MVQCAAAVVEQVTRGNLVLLKTNGGCGAIMCAKTNAGESPAASSGNRTKAYRVYVASGDDPTLLFAS
jgi:hypothetical protein